MAKRTYQEACHAMQSGVAMKMNYNRKETDEKHLRVGVNSAMVDSASLAKLLIAKGVITKDEYIAAITDGMNEEADRYEEELSALIGSPVSLA